MLLIGLYVILFDKKGHPWGWDININKQIVLALANDMIISQDVKMCHKNNSHWLW